MRNPADIIAELILGDEEIEDDQPLHFATAQTDLLLLEFEVGDRVQLHPALDRWMRGDRFGTVTKIGRRYVHVKLDRSGDTRPFVPERLTNYTHVTRTGAL